MSDQVTLTAYADEIRELIRHNRNDEALVICRHILRYFPKHVESVRQLAEASLEKRDLDAAQDLFRRVLSADPENAVAYVGLASVFEERQLTDEAVWHMERAFELSPTHTEIHKELLRLQGLNSARSRPRLKLTPGALARLYAHQGLLSQATQEFRAIVAGDPTRLDARTALAEMLWRTGRIHEAAEVAQDLLVPLPYCLKANLILGTAWKESGLPEGEAYLQRAQALDPTNQVAQRLLGTRSPLPTIEPLVPRYVEGAAPPPVIVEEKPAPAELPVEPIFDATPIHAAEPSAETVTESEIELGPSPKPDLPVSTLPPWLRSDTSDALAFSELPSVKPAVAEDGTTLPPWMSQAQAPVVEESAPVEEPAPPPAWMNRTEATIVEDVTPVMAEEEIPVEPAMPSQSQEIIPTEPAPVVAAEETIAEPTAVSESQEIISEEPAPIAATEAIVTEPAWLAQPQETISKEPTPAETAAEPTWFSQPQEAVSKESAFPVAEEKIPEEPLAWMSQLQEPASSDSTTLPAWLMQGEEIVAEKSAPPIAPKAPAEEFGNLPAWLTQGQEPAAEEIQVTPEVKEEFFPRETETPVENLPAETIHAAEPPVEEPPAPDWLERLRAERATPETPPAPKESALEYPLGEPVSAPAEAEIAPVPVERAAPKRARQPKGYARLIVAREHRDANRLDDALIEYDWIVQHAPRLTNDVIADLQVLVRRAGVPIEAHRILGDAYTRVDRLSEALERYRFLLDRVSGS